MGDGVMYEAVTGNLTYSAWTAGIAESSEPWHMVWLLKSFLRFDLVCSSRSCQGYH